MSWTHPGLAAVADLVGKRAGLTFASREASAELGIRRAMARAHLRDLPGYAGRLAADEGLFDDLISELTIGETYFFREPAQFRFLEREVLPEIANRRGATHPVRAWCAGCASGEEAYSLAILFAEQGIAEHAHLIATDISRSALAKAREASYGSWSLRGDSAARAMPYFNVAESSHRLHERIRRRVTLSHLNLALDAYPSFAAGIWGMDLIMCRNVLIYFDKHTVSQVAQRLCNSLADGGWLITASSDPPLWELANFQVITSEEGIFYRRPGPGLTVESTDQLPAREVAPTIEPEFAFGELGLQPEATAPFMMPPPSTLEDARIVLARGDFARVVQLTPSFAEDADVAVLHVRALANLDIGKAADACVEAIAKCRFSTELHYLHAVLLLETRQREEAAQALRRVLYLDRTLAIAHFTLGSVLRQLGDLAGARRAYRNARDLCSARPADEPLPLGDGETADRLAEAAGAELNLVERTEFP